MQQQPEDADASQPKLSATTQVLLGYEPDYSYAPVVEGGRKRAGSAAQGAAAAFAANCVQATVACGKPRWVFCKSAISQLHKKYPHLSKGYAAEQLDMVREDELQVVCGAALLPEGHSLQDLAYTDTLLGCSSAVEAVLYGASQRVLDGERMDSSTAFCAQCGAAELTTEDMEEQGCEAAPADWKQVPLCADCARNGLAPVLNVKASRTTAAARNKVLGQKRKAGGRAVQQEGATGGRGARTGRGGRSNTVATGRTRATDSDSDESVVLLSDSEPEQDPSAGSGSEGFAGGNDETSGSAASDDSYRAGYPSKRSCLETDQGRRVLRSRPGAKQ
jgi:hypothetical protein